MRIVVEPNEQLAALAQWRGADAEIWIFDLTLRRLALLLTRADANDILYVVGIGCKHITGPFRWDNVSLTIVRSDGAHPESLTRVVDASASFELLCTSVGLVRGLRSDITNSFGIEFLGDHS